MTDESTVGIWLWLILILIINATWIAMDIWLHAHHHEYLTVEAREALAAGGWKGLALAGSVGMTFGLLIYHFGYQRGV